MQNAASTVSVCIKLRYICLFHFIMWETAYMPTARHQCNNLKQLKYVVSWLREVILEMLTRCQAVALLFCYDEC